MIRLKQLQNANSHIFVTLDGIEISSIFDSKNDSFPIICKLEFVGNSNFLSFLQPKNVLSHIFVTLGGIKITSMFDLENAYFPIVCK